MKNLKEMAMEFIRMYDGNLYAENKSFNIYIGTLIVNVESIWHNRDEDKFYIHVGCPEFEGDLDIKSLSDENQEVLKKFFVDNYCF